MMFIQIALLVFVAGSCSRSAEAISCFICSNATHLPDCTQTTTCPSGSACFTNYTTAQGVRYYTLGCTSVWSCPTLTTSSTGGPSIVGRSVSTRAAPSPDTCSECCNTGNCNRKQCQTTDASCNDDHGYDCATIAVGFDICGDVAHAKQYCKRFCGFCNTIDGQWTSWSGWSICDVTCGNGTMTKTRTCSDPAPENGGSDCSGEANFYKTCTRDLCPIHGGWSSWSQWGSCSATCDVGLQRRDRSCSKPSPAHQGDHCYGDARDDRLCAPGACANGSWSSWGSWGACTSTCGGGVRTRSRDCDSPAPSMTGRYCDGDSMHSQSCNIGQCHVCHESWQNHPEPSAEVYVENIPTSYPGIRYGRKIRYILNDTAAWRLDVSTYIGGPVVFIAQHVSTLTPGDNSPLVFTQVDTNVGNGYDSSTGIFTAPVAGTYSFNVQFCAYYKKHVVVGLVVNNIYMTKMPVYGDADHSCRAFSYPALLKQGDKVQAKMVSHASSGQLFYQTSYYIHSFSGALLR